MLIDFRCRTAFIEDPSIQAASPLCSRAVRSRIPSGRPAMRWIPDFRPGVVAGRLSTLAGRRATEGWAPSGCSSGDASGRSSGKARVSISIRDTPRSRSDDRGKGTFLSPPCARGGRGDKISPSFPASRSALWSPGASRERRPLGSSPTSMFGPGGAGIRAPLRVNPGIGRRCRWEARTRCLALLRVL